MAESGGGFMPADESYLDSNAKPYSSNAHPFLIATSHIRAPPPPGDQPQHLERLSRIITHLTGSLLGVEYRTAINGFFHQTRTRHLTNRFMHELLPLILVHCPLNDVYRVAQTSRKLRSLVYHYINQALDQFLGKWLNNPQKFRAAMHDTSSLISGPAILSFILADQRWASNALQVTVPKGFKFEDMAAYLRVKERFTMGGTSRHASCFHAPTPNQARSITLHASDENSSIGFVDEMECSILMNYISATRIAVFHPNTTFSKVAIEHNRRFNLGQNAQTSGYALLGVTVLCSSRRLFRACGYECPALRRSSRDVGCLVVSLVAGLDDDIEPVTWNLNRPPRSPESTIKVHCNNPACPRNPRFDHIARIR